MQRTERSGLEPGSAVTERAQHLAGKIEDYTRDLLIPFCERFFCVRASGGASTPQGGPGSGERFVTLLEAAGLASAFALSAEAWKSPSLLDRAMAEAAHLDRYIDPGTGALLWLPREDAPADPVIRPVGVAAAVRALALTGRIAGRPDHVERAAHAFRVLMKQGRETRYGGLYAALSTDWRAVRTAHHPTAPLQAMAACQALLDATGEDEWRRCWREQAVFLVAAFFGPDSGVILSRPPQPPGTAHPESGGGSPDPVDYSAEAAWRLGVAAAALEEPGLADIARRLLGSKPAVHLPGSLDRRLLGSSGGRSQVPAEHDAGGSLRQTAAGLAALALQFARRPSMTALGRAEAQWELFRTSFSNMADLNIADLASRRDEPRQELLEPWAPAEATIPPMAVEACLSAAADLRMPKPPTIPAAAPRA